MGKASRLKKERRAGGLEHRNKRARNEATRHAAANPHAAAPGPQIQVWVADGPPMTGHELVEEFFGADDPAGLELAQAIFSATGAALLDLRFAVRQDDGSTFHATIYQQAWGMDAPRCFEWLLQQGAAQNHEGAGDYVQMFLRAFQAIDRKHEAWDKACWGLRSIVRLLRDREESRILEGMRSKGGNLADFAALIEAEELAELERVEFEEILAPRQEKRPVLTL